MLRRASPVESILTYATFLAISIALHLLVILGPPPGRKKTPTPDEKAAAEVRR